MLSESSLSSSGYSQENSLIFIIQNKHENDAKCNLTFEGVTENIVKFKGKYPNPDIQDFD